MERRDLAIVGVGLVIVMVMALVVKPVLTGKPIDPGVPLPFVPTPTPVATPPVQKASSSGPVATTATASPAVTVTPWGGNPRTMGVTGGNSDVAGTTRRSVLMAEPLENSTRVVTYATISSNRSGRTETFSMPFPYWELHYTVEPNESHFINRMQSPTMASVAGGTASEIIPYFSIRVIDAAYPDKVVRQIEPPGGIDADLWKKGDQYDPRPWIEKFYETDPGKTYYLDISTRMITSYRIDVKVPENYIGRF